MSEIYTIGYSGFGVEDFVATLKKHSINLLIDVRSCPHSAYRKDFNRRNILHVLEADGIIYRHFGREFGARQFNPEFFTDGVLDFEKFAQSTQFLDGVKKFEEAVKLGYKIAFMCAEKHPKNCHRCILVARAFHDKKYEIRHILDAENFITQADVEKILVDEHYKNFSLFEPFDYDKAVKQSYIWQSWKILHKFR